MIKQFGTGVIIATAFVHLLTHASLQFESECLGELDYEATTTAIAMAGAFMTFLVEFLGGQYVMHRRDLAGVAAGNSTTSSIRGAEEKSRDPAGLADLEGRRQQQLQTVCRENYEGDGHNIVEGDDNLSVWVMETGIIFHSIRMSCTPRYFFPKLTPTPSNWGNHRRRWRLWLLESAHRYSIPPNVRRSRPRLPHLHTHLCLHPL